MSSQADMRPAIKSGRLDPSVAFTTPVGPQRIHLHPSSISTMELDLDRAIDQARARHGRDIAIEIFKGDSLVVRRRVI